MSYAAIQARSSPGGRVGEARRRPAQRYARRAMRHRTGSRRSVSAPWRHLGAHFAVVHVVEVFQRSANGSPPFACLYANTSSSPATVATAMPQSASHYVFRIIIDAATPRESYAKWGVRHRPAAQVSGSSGSAKMRARCVRRDRGRKQERESRLAKPAGAEEGALQSTLQCQQRA